MCCTAVGSASQPIVEFLDEWNVEPLEEVSPAVIAKHTKVSGSRHHLVARRSESWKATNPVCPDCAHPPPLSKHIQVFVNGVWVGITREPANLAHTMRDLRRHLDFSQEVSIISDGPLKELRIFTDHGRTSRPLYIVEVSYIYLPIVMFR